MVSTSGSVKYVVGGASGPKSRGGFDITVGGEAGVGCCPCATAALVVTRAAAAPPSVATSWRREISLVICPLTLEKRTHVTPQWEVAALRLRAQPARWQSDAAASASSSTNGQASRPGPAPGRRFSRRSQRLARRFG